MDLEEAVPTKTKPPREDRDNPTVNLEPAVHRRVLTMINDALQPEDLMYEKINTGHHEGDPIHEDNPELRIEKRKPLLDRETARRIVDLRDKTYPLGFRNFKEVLDIARLPFRHFEDLFHHLGRIFFGSWSVFPQNIPRRGPGTSSGVIHAALLHTGKVAVHHRGRNHTAVESRG